MRTIAWASVDWIDWGDAPTWGGAVFAAAAAAAAMWTLRSQQEQIAEQRVFIEQQSENLQLERQALLVAAQERRESQARDVFLSSEPSYVYASNNSREPLTSVECSDGGRPAVRAMAVSDRQNLAAQLMAQLLRHGESTVVEDLGAQHIAVFQRPQGAAGPVTVTFTDAAGVRWTRDELGGLEEVQVATS
ncbi:hypothetical protein ACIBCS_42175 [Streptomyces phaeochromogenes]|uniref:hypothetical protein n=1 Tax=Streptomyces phaeochromogenes TaxID=1923 RepID=UPI0033C2D317